MSSWNEVKSFFVPKAASRKLEKDEEQEK